MQRNTGYFPTESLEPSINRLFSRSALNEGYLFRGSLNFCEAMKNQEFVAKLDALTPTGKTLPPLDIIIALMDETSDRLNQQEDKTK